MKLFIICLFSLMATSLGGETSVEDLLDEGNNQLTAKLFTEVVKQNKGKSVILSAFSVLQPLAQLGLASVGESHDELLKAIGLPNDNVTKQVFPLVNNRLRSVKGIELKTASKVYIPEGHQINPEFAAVSRNVFGSEVKNVDFAKSQETATEINNWVEDQTNHRIKDLVNPQSLTSDTRAVLVNAIYFKGSWNEKFDKNSTTERDFHVSKEKTIKVPTMFKNSEFKYGESKELDAKLLELPYEGDEASFLIVLPNEIEGITGLEEKLKNPSVLKKAVDEMYYTEMDIYLPKFKIETTTDLKEALKNIGITKLFTPGEARLEKLLKTNEDLYVSEAIQKAFIEINEEGAEAAAANVEIEETRSAKLSFSFTFNVDRPFYYVLQYKSTALFNGVFRE